jgi:hypothetical protein
MEPLDENELKQLLHEWEAPAAPAVYTAQSIRELYEAPFIRYPAAQSAKTPVEMVRIIGVADRERRRC